MQSAPEGTYGEPAQDSPPKRDPALGRRRPVLALALAAVLGGAGWYAFWQRPRELRERALAHARRGVERYDAGDLPAAVRDLAAATRLDPGNAHAWYLLGKAQRDEDPRTALPSLARAARLAPGDPLFQREYGRTLLDQGNAGEACAALQRAVQLTPDSAEAHVELGRAYLRRGGGRADFDLGVAEYRTALSLQPGDIRTRYRLAGALYQADRLPEASREFETALSLLDQGARTMPGKMDGLTPESAIWFSIVKSCHYQLAAIASRSGRPQEAERHQQIFQRMKQYVEQTQPLFKRLRADANDAAARKELARVFAGFGLPPEGPDGKAAAARWISGG